jgi:SAM-dependent methyltransferase
MEKRTGAVEAEVIGLTASDLKRLTELYHGRLDVHGADVRTVGWSSRSDQHLRFEVLCRGLDLRGKRILDIGCGLGDFIPWAEQKFGADFDYVGLDLSTRLVAAARQRFGGPRRRFIEGTLASGTPTGDFDISVLSGTLTFKTSDNISTMRSVLLGAWERSREAVCSNFMTSYADTMLEKNYHYRPEEILTFAKTLSRFVTLHHDYDLWEFTIQVFRQPTLTRGTAHQ